MPCAAAVSQVASRPANVREADGLLHLTLDVKSLGWLATLLLGLEIAMQYVLRRNLIFHKWLAFLLWATATWHTLRSMHLPEIKALNAAGLFFATAGWLLLVVQTAVGFALEKATGTARSTRGRYPSARIIPQNSATPNAAASATAAAKIQPPA